MFLWTQFRCTGTLWTDMGMGYVVYLHLQQVIRSRDSRPPAHWPPATQMNIIMHGDIYTTGCFRKKTHKILSAVNFVRRSRTCWPSETSSEPYVGNEQPIELINDAIDHWFKWLSFVVRSATTACCKLYLCQDFALKVLQQVLMFLNSSFTRCCNNKNRNITTVSFFRVSIAINFWTFGENHVTL